MLDFKKEIYVGDSDKPIIVQAIMYDGREALDIRKTYRDKKTGELKPDRRGVRFYFDDEATVDGEAYDAAQALLVALAEFDDAYTDYLEDSDG